MVDATAAGPNSIMVTWSGVPSSPSRSTVLSYRIEIFTASPTVSDSGSIFGQVSENELEVWLHFVFVS